MEPEATESLCPVCLRRLPSTREAENGTVLLCRTCPEHGEFRVPVWRGEPSFESWRRPKTPSAPPTVREGDGRGCPFDCGLCAEHGQHTCTAVVEITDRCDLGCPVCYASSTRNARPDPTLPGLLDRLRRLRAEAGACNVQFSGGEPTLCRDLPTLVAAAGQAGFPLVQVNSNGLRLAREPGYAETLAQAGLDSVFLQFDGPDQACLALRGRALLAEKLAAVRACAAAGLGVVLVPTLVPGLNDGFLGWILDRALELAPAVRGVHFQPAASFGRFPWSPESPRLTLPEVLTALVAQSSGRLRAGDFHPPGCEHERCSFSGVFLVGEDKGLTPLPAAASCGCPPEPAAEGARKARAFTARQWAAPAPSPALSAAADDFERFLARAGTGQRLTLSCMAFQDAWTLDLERVRGCCIHVPGADGRLVPFCLHNLTGADGRTLYRGARP